MKYLLIFSLCFQLVFASGSLHEVKNPRKTINSFASNKNSSILFLGEGAKLRDVTAISTILANPEEFVGKTVTIEGNILDVCPKAGCWMLDEYSGLKWQ